MKITVTFKNGNKREFDQHEFYEEFCDDHRVYKDMDDCTIPSDTGEAWADAIDTVEAAESWDDINLAEV